MNQNNSEVVANIVGATCSIMIIKSPAVAIGESVIIGNIGTEFALAESRIMIGALNASWNCKIGVDGQGNVLLVNDNGDSNISNAYYKGSCVFLKM